MVRKTLKASKRLENQGVIEVGADAL